MSLLLQMKGSSPLATNIHGAQKITEVSKLADILRLLMFKTNCRVLLFTSSLFSEMTGHKKRKILKKIELKTAAAGNAGHDMRSIMILPNT